METKTDSNKFLIGALFVIVGGVLLMRNLDIFPHVFPPFIFSWPMILIVIGLFNLSAKSDKTSGIILVSIGLIFLLPNILGVAIGSILKLWPILLIIAGISYINKQKKRTQQKYKLLQSDNSRAVNDTGYIEVSTLLGGSKKILDPVEFKGGNISSVFGGNEIDLTNCTLAEGIHYLDLSILFSGVVIIVPSDWNVQIEVTPILGGFADDRYINPGIIKDPNRVLVIKGTVMFGGGEIKSR